ncbi:unnamed protein product [Caenorhabditis auriculariae]|uniref:Uncharacterized protein n=1 Tax=Caenorhabditis auriculariae TaxID=2777116 RepID=A0A8S1HBK8_9PELO|nr:unnamed protein product [Caenorhabditis auriculariae]
MGCNNSKTVAKVNDVAAAATPAKAENEEPVQKKADTSKLSRTSSFQEPANDEFTIIRLLLLGAAESGKTTLLEQIRLLYKQNFSDAEMFHRRAFIYNTILQSMRMMIKMMDESGISYADPKNQENAKRIMEEGETQYGLFPQEYADRMVSVWNDDAVQKLYARRSAFNLNDSTKFFLDSFDSINRPDYQPSPKHLIMSYVPTIGVQNVIFTANNRSFQLFDIGGQRIDRRKWATMYDGIDAIFFCLAISEYDQTMNEDLVTNRLTDSLNLLQKISSEPKFLKNSDIFIFLNEVDVFCEKLNEIPLQNFQDQYHGNSSEEALKFIEDMAIQAMAGRDEYLYSIYRTVCIDTEMMAGILGNVFEEILERKL